MITDGKKPNQNKNKWIVGAMFFLGFSTFLVVVCVLGWQIRALSGQIGEIKLLVNRVNQDSIVSSATVKELRADLNRKEIKPLPVVQSPIYSSDSSGPASTLVVRGKESTLSEQATYKLLKLNIKLSLHTLCANHEGNFVGRETMGEFADSHVYTNKSPLRPHKDKDYHLFCTRLKAVAAVDDKEILNLLR